MEFRIALIVLLVIVSSCSNDKASTLQQNALPISGTWELISETKIEKNDTTFAESGKGQKMIKIINDTHFSFLRHDLAKGKDSTARFVAGGGRYNIRDNHYTEHLEYCNFREWEDNTFLFTVEIKNDTLIQRGTEKVEGIGVDRIIIEKYFRIK